MGQYITYSRVADYWAADLPVNRGRWNFDTLRYDYYLDDNVAFEAFKAGAVDRREETVAKNWATRYVGRNFSRGYIIKDEHTNTSAQDTQWLAFNIQRPIFADRRVRQAITTGVRFRMDEQGAVLQRLSARQQLFPEHRICRPQPARRSRAGPADADEKRTALGALQPVYQPPVSRGDGFDRANLLKADALLNAAGWTVKNQRRVNAATGKPLRFELLLLAGGNDRWVLPFQHNLQRLGIVMDIRQVDNSQYSNRRRSRDYDMMPSLWRAMPRPGTDLQISPGRPTIFTPATTRRGCKAR